MGILGRLVNLERIARRQRMRHTAVGQSVFEADLFGGRFAHTISMIIMFFIAFISA